MIKRIIIIIFLVCICLVLYFYPKYNTISGKVFGTYYEITTKGKNTILDKINKEFDIINNQMSIFVKDSEINKINNAKAGEEIKISSELFFVLKTSETISKQTNGYFDITTGGVVEKYGFGKDKDFNNESIIGYNNLILKNNIVIKKEDDIYINLSAIAKGYAVDKIAKILDENGYKNYMVNIGGEIFAKGQYKNKYWQIGIENPMKKFSSILIIPLKNMGIATSGNYHNFYYNNGIKYSHIINPKTEMPIKEDGLISVTVIEKEVVIADAFATALMAMGVSKAIEFANVNDIKVIFMIKENNKIIVIKSDSFRNYT